MKKFYFFAALIAGTVLTSCTSEDDLALSPPEVNVEDGYAPIVFNSLKNNITRGDITGKAAADSLGNQFVVTGFKGATTQTPVSIVFDNYLVEYGVNTAHTTESNSSNWEYVDKTPIHWATVNGITKQTIKYWDYSKAQYDFIAWSTGKKTAIFEGEPNDGEVLVTAIRPNSKDNTWDANNAAYTFTGTAKDLRDCYIADLVTVNKEGDAGYGEVTGYNQPVTLRFRQLGTKVRIALYETIPGYSVKEVKFYTAAATDDASPATAILFTTTANEIYTEGTYTVSFPTVDKPNDADNNQAHITFAPKLDANSQPTTQATTVSWGGLNYTIRENSEKSEDAIYLGRTSNTASFAGVADENFYHVFLPNQTGTNLNLRVDYTLEAIDGGGEEILVRGATAQVPLIYAQWKPGYAYTYLFKISDKTNGHTGVYDPLHPDDKTLNSDPAGLFPITFDAIVVNAEEDKTQETITLVSTPSITTYQNGSNVVNNNEYTYITVDATKPEITGEIYVTVNDGDNGSIDYEAVVPAPSVGDAVGAYYTQDAQDPTKYIACGKNDQAVDGVTYFRMKSKLEKGNLAVLTAENAALYTIPEGTTEAEVIDALQMQDDDIPSGVTIKGRNKVELTTATLTPTDKVTYGVDGNTITLTGNQAAKFIPVAGKTYAFVYTKTAPTAANDEPKYQPIPFNDANVTTKYCYATTAVASAGDVQKNVVYFAPTGGTPALAKHSVFLGQGAKNLYIDNSGAKELATTDYAVTNTTYYYTLDNGTSFIQAKNINYADFNKTGDDQLYVLSGAYYVEKDASETEPVDGKAYYYRTGTGAANDPYVYTYCVILPEQTATTWYTLNDPIEYVKVASGENEIGDMTYFDMYTKNDGEYYTKVIKVQ